MNMGRVWGLAALLAVLHLVFLATALSLDSDPWLIAFVANCASMLGIILAAGRRIHWTAGCALVVWYVSVSWPLLTASAIAIALFAILLNGLRDGAPLGALRKTTES